MTTDWTFLEPWYAALQPSIIQLKPMDSGSGMEVSFKWPLLKYMFSHYPTYQYYLLIRLGEEQQNVMQLMQIREAIELFTVLSVVNNGAFMERFPRRTCMLSVDQDNCYPIWKVYVRGPATVQQVTWSKLGAMGLEAVGTEYFLRCEGTEWTCKFEGADVAVYLILDQEIDTTNGIETDLHRLFTPGVHLIVQLLALQ